MKFHCERSLLLNAVTIASRTVSTKTTIPALEGLLFEAGETELTITGYNMKTGIRTKLGADISEGGRLVLNARLLGEILRKMPEGEVSFSSDSSLLVKLTCGMSYFEIMGIDGEEFPELPAVEIQNSLRIKEKKLQGIISQTLFAVSTNESRPVHTGSLFEVGDGVLTVTSVDGYRLAQRREELDEETEFNSSFVAPGTTLSEVEKICASDGEEPVLISLGTRHIMFSVGDTEVISRRLEGEFLDYTKSVPKESRIHLKADRRSLLSAFERVSLLISEKYKAPLRCVFTDGLVKLSTATAMGKATDECPLSGDGEGLEIGFNNRYMMDALRAAPTDELDIALNSATAPCVITPAEEDGSFLYLILPVRLRPGE